VTNRRLIVNADGFGFGAGATQGVIDAIREGGFISSISVTPNFPEAERVRDLVAEFPQISIGVHVNPMVGSPCLSPTSVPSLVGRDGQFHGTKFPALLKKGMISAEELEAELDAQLSKVRSWAGNRLTHIDSHGNRHLDYFNVFLRVARKWSFQRIRNNASVICLESPEPRRTRFSVYLGKPQLWLAHRYRRIQMRRARRAGLRMADDLVTVGYAGTGNKTNLQNWIRILQNLPSGTHEIYCHPAYPDETLRRWAHYSEDRALELAILRRQELRSKAKELGVELISFDAI
jgi:predicted glycoside hydrolase/deacetylase ChbG (UPF0249 family)